MFLVSHGAGQPGTDRAKQGEAGEGGDQFFRQCGEHRGQGGAKGAHQNVEHPAGDPGHVAFIAVFVGFAAGADRCGNGRQVKTVGTERGHQDRANRGDRNDRACWRVVARGAQHGHAWHVLAGQGHQRQWQADIDDCVPAPFRGDEDRLGHGDGDRGAVEFTERGGHRATDDQHRQDRVAWRKALEDQVRRDHRQHQRRLQLDRGEQLGAEAEQDPGEHGGGNGLGQAAHQFVERTGQADQRDDHRRHHIGTDGLGQGHGGQHRHQ
ncbi:hypothetical protein D3C76_1009240 [compost metagenome]